MIQGIYKYADGHLSLDSCQGLDSELLAVLTVLCDNTSFVCVGKTSTV